MATIPVDLSKTGGKLLSPGGQMIAPEQLAAMTPDPKSSTTTSKPETPQAKPAVEDTPAETAPVNATCRYCGHDPKEDPNHPSPDDLLEFTKCVWRDTPFTKRYDFFGGAVSITYRTLSAEETEQSQRAVMADVNNDPNMVGLLGALAMTDRGVEYQMALSVVELSVGDRKYTPTETDPRLALKAVRQTLGSQIAHQTARNAFYKFLGVTKRLLELGNDPSFWQATPSAGPSPASPSPATSV